MTFVKSCRFRNWLRFDHLLWGILQGQGLDAELTLYELEDLLGYSIRFQDILNEDYDILETEAPIREYRKFDKKQVNAQSHHPEL